MVGIAGLIHASKFRYNISADCLCREAMHFPTLVGMIMRNNVHDDLYLISSNSNNIIVKVLSSCQVY